MSMLTRTGTTVRKHRRRLSSKQRRGSAPTILLPSTVPATSTPPVSVDLTGKGHLNPQPSPAKSVSFTFEKGSVCPSIVDEAEVVPGVPVYEACSHHLVRDRSYSLVAALQEANLEAETTCDFVEKSCDIIFNTRLVTLLLGLLIAFPMAMMTAGGKYLDECPKEPKIPIYLLVGGCFGLFKLLFIMWRQVRRRYHDHMDDFVEGADAGEVVTISRMTSVSLSLFLCVWFVLGNYWVFSIWTPLFESPLHDPQNWCDRHVYMFAFWQIIICYVLITGFLLLCLFLLCCHWTLWCLTTSPDSFC